MANTWLYLARHGAQQHSSADGDGDGSGDEPSLGLSALGEEQARLLGVRLAGISFEAVRHSPLRRAAETAQILSGYLPGVPVSASELLADRTPVPTGAQEDTVPTRYRWFFGTVPPAERDHGGAQLDAAFARLAVAGEADRRELLITHNFVIGWFVRHVLDAPWWRWMSLNQANCGLTVIKVSSGEPAALVTFNDTGHLTG